MIGRGVPHAGLVMLLAALGACAEPDHDVRVDGLAVGGGGSDATGGGSCQAPTCGACTTCKDMCLCTGKSLTQCQAVCGSASTGGSGGSGGSGATAGSGASAGFAGSFGGGGAGGGSTTCAVKVGDPACDACVASQCCQEAEACAYDPSCGDLMNCLAQAPACSTAYSLSELLSCADTACPSEAAGKPALSGYFGCLATRCSTECGL